MPTSMIRNGIKRALSYVPAAWYDRASGFSSTRTEFSELRDKPSFHSREILWANLFNEKVGEGRKALVLEFGVWQGYSMGHFAKLNKNPESLFFGFDSFEGLPEEWLFTLPKGAFNTSGLLPNVDDSRIRFVKGWFQNSLPRFVDEQQELFRRARTGEYAVIVHFDADIYSSTLFLVTSLYWLFDKYFFILDEFTGEERRAFYGFTQAYQPGIEFYAKVPDRPFGVAQVTGFMTKAKYEPRS